MRERGFFNRIAGDTPPVQLDQESISLREIALDFVPETQANEDRAAHNLEAGALELAREIVSGVADWHSSQANPGDRLSMKVIKEAAMTPENKVEWQMQTRALDIAQENLAEMGIQCEITSFTRQYGEWNSKHLLSVPGKNLTVFSPQEAETES